MSHSDKRSEFLYMFRRCRTIDTVERLYEHKRDIVSSEHLSDFLSAYDHRKAEIYHGKIWDKVPASAWWNVK
ncbi:hypothetical protein BXI69_22755 [Salmonella enterica subsp. enterica serovar Enteritidis]|nr:hypothetical protein [Salmonella enterica subsp. enterica serovar Enteritidis]EET0153552.1 hypothetical protein [Escherichia coli]EET8910465.1 hypothetical protein [Escherichia coli]